MLNNYIIPCLRKEGQSFVYLEIRPIMFVLALNANLICLFVLVLVSVLRIIELVAHLKISKISLMDYKLF